MLADTDADSVAASEENEPLLEGFPQWQGINGPAVTRKLTPRRVWGPAGGLPRPLEGAQSDR